MGAERWDEQVGSVADEAGRLLESLRRSAAEAAEAAEAARGSAADVRPASGADVDVDDARDHHDGPDHHDHDPHDSHHDPLTGGAAPPDPVCQWCPICRGAAVVRSLSPETLTRLADLASVAASVLADLASARASADPTTAHPTTAHARTPARGPRPAASRPIPVSDAGDAPEAPRG